jgi:capsular polysaccharide biosynthesis protein
MNMENEEQILEGEISLTDIWNTIRRRFILIILVLVVCVFASVLYLQNIVEEFTSTATLLVQTPSSTIQSSPFPDYSNSERWTQTYAEMLKGEPILIETAKRIYYPRKTKDQIKKSLTVEAVRNTLLLKVSYTDISRTVAKRVVDTVSEVFIEKTSDLYKSNIQASTKKLEDNITSIENQIEAINKDLYEKSLSPEDILLKQNEREKLYNIKSILDEQLSKQIITEQQLTPSVKVYQEGTTPTSPSNKKDTLTISIAAVLGLFLGLLLAFLLEYLDDTIKTEEDIKRVTNQRVLGVIPRFGLKAENSYYYPYSQGKYYKKPS